MVKSLFRALASGLSHRESSDSTGNRRNRLSGPMTEMLEPRCLLSVSPVPDEAAAPATQTAAYTQAATAATGIAPTAVVAQRASTTKVNLTWVDNSKRRAHFRVIFRSAAATVWKVAGIAPVGAKRFQVADLAAGRKYLFRVQALTPQGASGGSAIVSATTFALNAGQIKGSTGSSTSASTGDNAGVINGITYTGPIVITQGGTYSGNWQSLDANVPAVRVRTSELVIIENSNIRSRGTLIDAANDVNLTVRNTSGYGLNPNVRGRHPGRFLDAERFVNIDLENNYMDGTSGIYLYRYVGNHTAAQSVTVVANQALNIDGRFSNGNGGFLTGRDDNTYVQFFQINGVADLPGVEIAWNQVVNEPGRSRVEDNINIFNSSGTPNSPFRIHDNFILGAYPADPVNDDDYAGGGIMVSDYNSNYVSAYSNQVINTTNYGIAISSGHDNAFYDNRIISCGTLADGRRLASQNVGAYIWNMDGDPTFANNTGSRNLIGWVYGDRFNNYWIPDAADWEDNDSVDGAVTRDTELAEWTIWQDKRTRSGIWVGPATA